MARKQLLICILLFLLPLSNTAQKGVPQQKSPFQRALELGESNFKQGNYAKALNAYNFALNLLYVAEDKKGLEERVKQITALLSAYKDMYASFNNENYDEALSIITKIKRLNPQDPRVASLEQKVKTIAGIPLPPPKNAQTPTDRWVKIAQDLIKKGDIPRARSIIAILPTSPIKTKLEQQIAIIIQQPPTSRTGLTPCEEDKKKYQVLRSKMNVAFGDCELQKARGHALEILNLECYKTDNYTRKSLSVITEVQSKLREIESLKSGSAPSAATYIIPIYKSLSRTYNKCIEYDYFYYVFGLTERQKSLNPCNKDLILKYQDLIAISPSLATKENIEEKITAVEECSSCDTKELVLLKLLQEGKSLYLQCRYEEALQKFNLSKEYRCSTKEIPLLTEWETLILSDIETNLETTKRFNSLKSSADSLMALQECSKALKLYREAELLNSSCTVLQKSDLPQKIAFAECCATTQEVTVLVDSSRRARQLNFFIDACRFLEEAVKISANSTCISLERKSQLIAEQKVVCCRAYPERGECKIIPPPDSSSFSLDIYGGGFTSQSKFSSDSRPPYEYLGWGGFSAGIMGTISDKKSIEVGLGAGFVQSFYFISGELGLTDKFVIQSVDIPLNFTFFLNKKKKNEYGNQGAFLLGSGALQVPVKFAYKNYIFGEELSSTQYLNEIPFSFKAGMGYRYKKLTASLFYEKPSNPLSKQSIIAPIRLSAIESNRIGVELKFSLFKTYGPGKKKNKK